MNELIKSEAAEWVDINGFEGFYKINQKGDIKSLERLVKSRSGKRIVSERIMKISKSHGYDIVMMQVNGKKKTSRVHRLLAEAFIPKIKGKDYINHKNGIKDDNRIENLEWCNISENVKHAYSLGNMVAPSQKFDDIHMLTYATCIHKFSVEEMKGYMTFQSFRFALRGKAKYGCTEAINGFMKEFPMLKGPARTNQLLRVAREYQEKYKETKL
jgi:hypothetical protein